MSKKKTAQLLESLNERIDKVQSSSEFKKVLKFFSKFHNYSYQNSMLILMQKPEASFVAGYRQWQKKFNRHVKKGEKGIAILAPFTYKKEVKKSNLNSNVDDEETEEVKRTYFNTVYVFDISQTEGEPVPEMDMEIENSNKELISLLLDYAASQEIEVNFKTLSGATDGYSRGGEIAIKDNANETEQASILVHELAHEHLHFSNESNSLNLSKEIIEMEAEAVAFVVMDYFNIESKSDKYLALYKENYDLMESFKRINDVSCRILDYLLSAADNDDSREEQTDK
jgi:Zn-dependent peptidase ImmA (M78 family)